MKVEAINGVNYRSNFTFGERIKTDNEHKNYENTSSSPLKALQKVPVIVLLAMNPATLNSAIPTQPEADDPNHIVMVASESEKAESAYATYPQVESTQQSDAPFGWARFKGAANNIKFSMPAKGNGANYHMLFTAMRSDKDKIDAIYFVKDGSVGSVDAGAHPPQVQTFIYHNLGDASFCSVITLESMLGSNRRENGNTVRQIVLDDDTSQKIIDLLSGDTKWKNNTHIAFKEVFDAKISMPKTVMY